MSATFNIPQTFQQMKKILALLLLSMFTLNIVAQDHMQFMGLPIDGSLGVFTTKLKAKGFKKKSSFETSVTLWGKFANEIVELTILASPRTETVCKVIVLFPKQSSWKDLKNDYLAKKNLYKSKYLMDSSYEFFKSPYDEGDGYEERAVKQDCCSYCSFFTESNGGIIVEIAKTFQVRVSYEDTENMKQAKRELETSAFLDI